VHCRDGERNAPSGTGGYGKSRIWNPLNGTTGMGHISVERAKDAFAIWALNHLAQKGVRHGGNPNLLVH
jgi:hypothetical protein